MHNIARMYCPLTHCLNHLATTWSKLQNRALQNVDLSLHQWGIWTLQKEHQSAYFYSIKWGAWEAGLECSAPKIAAKICHWLFNQLSVTTVYYRSGEEGPLFSFSLCRGIYDQNILAWTLFFPLVHFKPWPISCVLQFCFCLSKTSTSIFIYPSVYASVYLSIYLVL